MAYAADIGDRLALVKQLLIFPQLANDLLWVVAFDFHGGLLLANSDR